ncbi:pyridoxal phosphate-dependent aminotransferase [Chitinivibrio alkaliphilus]|uniref:alanine transaminase n=1 Tax=Chitinivibrio alkaliphilus ACht1 TaxID=1313304 RepID=U7D6G8_9BACT|nr:pyridoxal phosphate-dependent aminotransferase [Chitinivibrio alkaliphilus]ERP31166.1 Aspartate aminotransferase [Chitinivibrio alkaliphilus ACht1]
MLEQSERLRQVKYAIRGPVLEAAYEMEKRGEKILKLNIGNPGVFGFDADPSLLSAMQENLLGSDGAQSYSHSQGITSAREAIVSYHTERGVSGIDIDDVFIGNGASELISMSLQALLNPGDEVLIPAPDYPLWTASVNLADGTPIHYLCNESDGWNPDLTDMASKISSKTRAIVIINPNNPTGGVYSEETLKGIVALAKKHNLLLLADEIYDRILFDGARHIPLAALAGDHPCLTFNGISKTHLACGFRGGWLVLSGNTDELQNYKQGLATLASMRLCSNVAAQYACKAALEFDTQMKEFVHPEGRLHRQHTKAWEALNSIDGISCVKAEGALYLFPKIDTEKFGIHDDEQFVLDFLREKKVLIVNGTGFNWPQPDHFRIVVLPKESELLDAIERLRSFLSTYRQV